MLCQIEKNIVQQKISIGNKVLYDLCEKSWDDEKYLDENPLGQEYLAAQMWLIGRSYAASPERRNYKVKVKFTNSGDGLDTFFDCLAHKLLERGTDVNKEYMEVLRYLSLHKNFGYTFDDEEKDLKVLCDSIRAVELFNETIKKARYKIDEEDIKKSGVDNLQQIQEGQSNLISFCSKFLHFHAPNFVFIKDGITGSHFKSTGKYYGFQFKESIKSEIIIPRDDIKAMFEKIKKFNDCSLLSDYGKHCIKEYLLAKEIRKHTEGEMGSAPITRIVDTYMLMANVCKDD